MFDQKKGGLYKSQGRNNFKDKEKQLASMVSQERKNHRKHNNRRNMSNCLKLDNTSDLEEDAKSTF